MCVGVISTRNDIVLLILGSPKDASIKNDQIYAAAVGQIPMGRHARPLEMVGEALYLVSDAASFTTGTCISCDGGMLV